jgi:hypothetical protein
MLAQLIRISATRPASIASCSAMPTGDVNTLVKVEPRLFLTAEAAVT